MDCKLVYLTGIHSEIILYQTSTIEIVPPPFPPPAFFYFSLYRTLPFSSILILYPPVYLSFYLSIYLSIYLYMTFFLIASLVARPRQIRNYYRKYPPLIVSATFWVHRFLCWLMTHDIRPHVKWRSLARMGRSLNC